MEDSRSIRAKLHSLIDSNLKMMRFLVTLALALSCSIAAQAALISSNLYTLATVNLTTNNGPVTAMGTVTLPQWTTMVQSIGTGGVNTNAGGNILVSFGPTTNGAVVIATYNATNDTIYPLLPTNNGTVGVYFFFRAFNTSPSNIQLSAQSVIQNQ